MVDFKFQIGLIGYVRYNEQIMFKIRSDGESIKFNLILNYEIIGEATITTMDYFMVNHPCYYIHSVGINANLHNMGYGTILMNFVVEWLKKLHGKYGLDYAMLYMTQERLEDKIRFYKRVGFVLTQYKNHDITPMFFSFNEKGNDVINQVSVANEKNKKAYDTEFSFFTEKAKILSKQDLYDLLYKRAMNLQMPIQVGYDLKNTENAKLNAIRNAYYTYIQDNEHFSWFNIFDVLYAKWIKK